MGGNFHWLIYLIRFEDGSCYVGATRDLKRRLKEHRRVFGFAPSAETLEVGHSIQWRDAEHRWIEKFRRAGVRLRNKTSGRNGVESLSAASRLKLSAKQRGKVVSPETRARISVAQKGVPKSFSPQGEILAQRSRFKPGHRNWDHLTQTAKESHRAAAKAQWVKIPSEMRSRLASSRAKIEWDARSAEDRKQVGKRISDGKLHARSAEARTISARAGGVSLHANDPTAAERISKTMKSWWANLTPEYRTEYLARRSAARKAARESSKKP